MRIALVIHDIRSALNVGSLLRSADGLGVDQVYMTGYTPYPEVKGDERLPHVSRRAAEQIKKTALGAEKSVNWSHRPDIDSLITNLKADGFTIVALEQTANSQKLPGFRSVEDVALIVGSEVEGISQDILKAADLSLEIPMSGAKESFNVAVAGAIALYQLRWQDKL